MTTRKAQQSTVQMPSIEFKNMGKREKKKGLFRFFWF